LVVEDEEKIARLLELEPEFEGYEVTKAEDGIEALEKYRTQPWDLILLAVMLPRIDGIEVLRRMRKHDPVSHDIMLTAKSSVDDKVTGLDLGANDYVTKPFSIEELLARIRACLRMQTLTVEREEDDGWEEFGGLRINEKLREVVRDGNEVELTPREFDL